MKILFQHFKIIFLLIFEIFIHNSKTIAGQVFSNPTIFIQFYIKFVGHFGSHIGMFHPFLQATKALRKSDV
jgi:hypothetical protein